MRPNLLKMVQDQQFAQRNLSWRPTNVLDPVFGRGLLNTVRDWLKAFEACLPELEGLDRKTAYILQFQKLRLAFRQAQYSWRVDDLQFIEAIQTFFSTYGAILKLLKIDELRGLLKE